MTTPVAVGTAEWAGFRTRTLAVPAARSATSASGPGPDVVLLHGFGDSADTWRGVLRALSDGGSAAIAADLPGLGHADDLRPGAWLPQLDAFAADLVRSTSRGRPVVLVGNSLGAMVALRAAAGDLPVMGVVSIAEPSSADHWIMRRFTRDRAGLLIRALHTRLPLPDRATEQVVATLLRAALHNQGARGDALFRRQFAADFVRRGGLPWLARSARKLALESRDGFDHEAIACPVLVVHGARDRVVPVNSAHRLHAALPDSRLVVEPTWGHCPQLDAPREVAGLVLEFTRSLAAGQTGQSGRFPGRGGVGSGS